MGYDQNMTIEKADNKFIEELDVSDWEIETPTGFKTIKRMFKTVPYDVWNVETDMGKQLMAADEHVLLSFDDEIFVKDLIPGQTWIRTKDGYLNEHELVMDCFKTNRIEHMYDIEIEDDEHVYWTNEILSHNTSTIGAVCLHYALFNPSKTVTIFANKADTSREILNKITVGLENLPFFLQPGVKNYNKGSIEFDNGSRILSFATTSSSARSYSASLVYLDEFAWVDNDVEFYTSVYPIISSGKTSKVIISSTPNGLNLFYKLWTDAKNKRNDFVPIEVFWWEVPGRDEEWKRKTIQNTSERQFEQEFGCKFLGSNGTLIPSHVLETLAYEDPLTDSKASYKVYTSVLKNHQYLLCVDVARGTGRDYSAISVIDITQKPYEQVAVFRDNEISVLELVEKVVNIAMKYNQAYVLVESNDLGSQVLDDLNFVYDYDNIIMIDRKLGLKTTKRTKLLGCIRLKELLTSNLLLIKNYETILELSCFVEKQGSYAADKDSDHDDLVMTLVLFAYFEKTNDFESIKEDVLEEQSEDYSTPPDIMSSDDEQEALAETNWLFQ